MKLNKVIWHQTVSARTKITPHELPPNNTCCCTWPDAAHTNDLLINWSTSELNRQLNPTTCLGDTDCWIQQVTAPTLVLSGARVPWPFSRNSSAKKKTAGQEDHNIRLNKRKKRNHDLFKLWEGLSQFPWNSSWRGVSHFFILAFF